VTHAEDLQQLKDSFAQHAEAFRSETQADAERKDTAIAAAEERMANLTASVEGLRAEVVQETESRAVLEEQHQRLGVDFSELQAQDRQAGSTVPEAPVAQHELVNELENLRAQHAQMNKQHEDSSANSRAALKELDTTRKAFDSERESWKQKVHNLQQALEQQREEHEQLSRTHEESKNDSSQLWGLVEQAKQELASKDKELSLLRQQTPGQPAPAPTSEMFDVASSMGKDVKDVTKMFKKDISKIGSKMKKMDMGILGGKSKFSLQGAGLAGSKPKSEVLPDVEVQPEQGVQRQEDAQVSSEPSPDASAYAGNPGAPQGASLLD